MAKILLVEDDNNLREIYEARLQAEGFTIVSAKDGEEALVVAKKENPDLIISDVMMPRVSGFEMLDILRNTQGFKDTKVIMLTALGQAEDQARADKLGADRYLVKSQVTLEDIVNAADELLGNVAGAPAPTAAAAASPAVVPTPAAAPAVPAPAAPVVTPPEPATAPAVPTPTATAPANTSAPQPTAAVTPMPPVAPAPTVVTNASVPVPATAPAPASTATLPSPAMPAVPKVEVAPTSTAARAVNAPAAVPAPAAATPPVESAPASTASEPKPAEPATAAVIAPAASDDKLMAEAVHDLLGAADPTPAPEPATAPAAAPAEIKAAPTATPNGTPTLKNVSAEPTIPTSTPSIPVAAPPAEPTTTPPTLPEPKPDDSTPQPVEQPAPQAPTTPPAVVEQRSEVKPIEPAAEKEKEDEPDNDAVTIARKKVIAPLADPDAPPQDDLNTLLAKEGMAEFATEPDDSNGQMVAPHPPGHVISPSTPAPGTNSAPTPNNNGIDPNSIAL